uniref:ATP-dependent DNA helicase n=1 Tax=Brassica oleracea var. oleracea TaxID=109376 RepID=A0A0D2ZQQ3_BRAOL
MGDLLNGNENELKKCGFRRLPRAFIGGGRLNVITAHEVGDGGDGGCGGDGGDGGSGGDGGDGGDSGDSGGGSLQKEFVIPTNDDPQQSLSEAAYPDFVKNYLNRCYLTERAILAPTNASARDINAYLLSKVLSAEKDYLSADLPSNLHQKMTGHQTTHKNILTHSSSQACPLTNLVSRLASQL